MKLLEAARPRAGPRPGSPVLPAPMALSKGLRLLVRLDPTRPSSVLLEARGRGDCLLFEAGAVATLGECRAPRAPHAGGDARELVKAPDSVESWGLAAFSSPTGRTPAAWGSPGALVHRSNRCEGHQRAGPSGWTMRRSPLGGMSPGALFPGRGWGGVGASVPGEPTGSNSAPGAQCGSLACSGHPEEGALRRSLPSAPLLVHLLNTPKLHCLA